MNERPVGSVGIINADTACGPVCLIFFGNGLGKRGKRLLFVCVNGFKHAQSLAILLRLSLHQNLGRRDVRKRD